MRSCRPAAEGAYGRLSGGKRTFDATTFDILEHQCQFEINQTLRNQGNRYPFTFASKRSPISTRALARICGGSVTW
jgi:hypothetical protein